ncbi:DUF2169 family type VI secretion system accessory protein [Polyangium spumosum]|uniref:DUF2169 domain-containing protein n=1 Tax=Polyangium spumosum TaxID=889282 RepID=A0A6N7PLN3_9BACT|nr:DUF2169 domain-containing protein [Polyangium spumosum]MRG92983.1 DUF2169 domain-containing protein [Polyangium spumosum]
MDVVSTCPLRVSTRTWTTARGAPVLTVACKATYVLLPGTSQLAPEQEPINEEDNYWDDDPARSLHAPSDLAPYKPCADVVLVGHAFAPGRVPVPSFHVRLIVGDIDKSIEVSGDRLWAADGTIQDMGRITRMPLRYERAGGGPGTWNPVGVRCNGPGDGYGRIPLPNLLPPGKTPTRRGEFVEPIGFGPLAPTWPTRMEKLGAYAGIWDPRRWHERALPEGFDASFFNVAPRDQNVSELRGNERIVLENLHPEHERLATSLPGLNPRAVAERAPGRREEITLTADSMWIDTERGLCTLVWRGRLSLAHPHEQGRITVSLEEPRAAAPPPAPPAAPPAPASEKPRRPLTMTMDPSEATIVRPIEAARQVMPFMQGAPESASPGSVRPPSALAGLPFASLTPATPAPPAVAPAPPSAPPARWPSSPDLPVMAPPPPAPVPPAPAWTPSPPSAVESAARVSIGQRVVAESVPSAVEPVAVEPAPPAPSVSPRSAPRFSPTDPYVDLLWFDKAAPKRVRAQASFASELRDGESQGAWLTLEDTQQPKQEIKDRRDVLRVLRRVQPVDADGVSRVMVESIDEEGAITPPLVVVSGEVQLFFHEVQTLKATIAVTSPLAGADKRLRETLDAANELVGSDWKCTALAAEGMTIRLREAFVQANRTLPTNYLDQNVERVLLEQRSYQKRVILGEKRIRSAMVPEGASAAIPCYLSEELEAKLPLFSRFRAVVIAEARGQQDQYETNPLALVALALGRVLSMPGRR